MAAFSAQGYGHSHAAFQARASSLFLKHCDRVVTSRPLSDMPDKGCQGKDLF